MANNYYQKHKEKFEKEARERCQNLSEVEKKQKRPENNINILQNKKKKKASASSST